VGKINPKIPSSGSGKSKRRKWSVKEKLHALSGLEKTLETNNSLLINTAVHVINYHSRLR
jgi:hypothetical protein